LLDDAQINLYNPWWGREGWEAEDPHLRRLRTRAVQLPALYRRYEPSERSAEAFPCPERLHVWGTSRGGEIDFVCGPRGAIDAVEVADWNRTSRQKATAPMRAAARPALARGDARRARLRSDGQPRARVVAAVGSLRLTRRIACPAWER
jgi:hypothetical protein